MTRVRQPLLPRLLGIKLVHAEDGLRVARFPRWYPDEAIDKFVDELTDEFAATGENVRVMRHGRYIRVERVAE